MGQGHPQIWGHRGPRRNGAGVSANWDHRAPRRFGARTSAAFGPPMLPPLRGKGLRHFGITEAPAAMERGPPLLWDHRGAPAMAQEPLLPWGHWAPRLCGARISAALAAPMLPRLWGKARRFGITQAPATWVRGPRWLWDHRGPHRGRAGECATLGPPRPRCFRGEDLRRFGCGGLRRFWITEVAAALGQGLPPLWDHRGPGRFGARASTPLGPPGPPPLWDHRGLRCFGKRDPTHKTIFNMGDIKTSSWCLQTPSVLVFQWPSRGPLISQGEGLRQQMLTFARGAGGGREGRGGCKRRI